MAHRNEIGVVKDAIKIYLWSYGAKEKRDIREFLRMNFPDIPFKTYDTIDKHILDLKNSGDIGIHDERDKTLISITRKAIDNLIEDLDKDQLRKELNDWDYHLKMEEKREEIKALVVKSIIELREKGYAKPF